MALERLPCACRRRRRHCDPGWTSLSSVIPGADWHLRPILQAALWRPNHELPLVAAAVHQHPLKRKPVDIGAQIG